MHFHICLPKQPTCKHSKFGTSKKNSTKGKHLVECYGTAHNIEWDVIDASCGFEKLKKIEAIYSKLLKPQRTTNAGY